MTEVIAVQNTASSELLKLLRPLIPQYGHIGSVTTPNVVIISDHADNILRLKKLIREIDVTKMKTGCYGAPTRGVGRQCCFDP